MKVSHLVSKMEKALEKLKKLDGEMKVGYFGLDEDGYSDPQPLKTLSLSIEKSDEEQPTIDLILKVSYKDY